MFDSTASTTPTPAPSSRLVSTILLALEPSAASRAATDWAAALATRGGSRLYALHVMSRVARALPASLLDMVALDRLAAQVEGRVRAEVDAMRDHARPPLAECVRFGRPDREISALASELRADLIVTGTHARKGVARLVRGSVAWSVVRHAPCPVVVVPGSIGERAPGAPLARRVLVALDDSEDARAALVAAAALADLDGGEIHAVHAVDGRPRAGRDDLITSTQRELARWIEKTLPGRAARVTATVGMGEAGRVLSELARGGRYDLVACGTHGRAGVARALFGSVAAMLAGTAPCPVLIARVC